MGGAWEWRRFFEWGEEARQSTKIAEKLLSGVHWVLLFGEARVCLPKAAGKKLPKVAGKKLPKAAGKKLERLRRNAAYARPRTKTGNDVPHFRRKVDGRRSSGVYVLRLIRKVPVCALQHTGARPGRI